MTTITKSSEGIDAIWPEPEARIAAHWSEYGIGIAYLDDAQREQPTMQQSRKRIREV